jgi:hypothetical protein
VGVSLPLKIELILKNTTVFFFLIIFIGSLFIVFSLPPLPFDPKYHEFADKRIFLGVPHFFDVMSNVPYLIFGLMGIYFSFQSYKEKKISWPFFFFFTGIFYVCFGSIYYHLHPTTERLIWDRVPMTFAFMGLLVGLMDQFIWEKSTKYFLIPFLLLGLFSVFYWYHLEIQNNGDQRLYFWVQSIPLIMICFCLFNSKPFFKKTKFYFYALLFYLVSKIFEFNDHKIFLITDNYLSGHTLKHLSSSFSIFLILSGLKKRED